MSWEFWGLYVLGLVPTTFMVIWVHEQSAQMSGYRRVLVVVLWPLSALLMLGLIIESLLKNAKRKAT